MAYSSLANWDGSQASSPRRSRTRSLAAQTAPSQRQDGVTSAGGQLSASVGPAARTGDQARSVGPSSMADALPRSSARGEPDPLDSEVDTADVEMSLEDIGKDLESGVVGAGVRDAVISSFAFSG